MINNLDDYIKSKGIMAQEWLKLYFDYIAKNYPKYQITIFRGCPMYKKSKSYLDGYLMITAAKEHISFHTLDFDLINEYKTKLPKASFGKGCIKVKFKDKDYQIILFEFCTKVLNQFE